MVAPPFCSKKTVVPCRFRQRCAVLLSSLPPIDSDAQRASGQRCLQAEARHQLGSIFGEGALQDNSVCLLTSAGFGSLPASSALMLRMRFALLLVCLRMMSCGDTAW